jgi:hypothetical protein
MNDYLKLAVISLITFMPQTVISQDSSASIGGTVYGPFGEAVPDAPIQITNTATDDYQRIRSDVSGDYKMAGLSAGQYKLTINLPCCTYGPYASEEIEIVVGEAVEFDVRLQQGSSISTVGDNLTVVAATLRERQIIPDLPVPRMSNEKPDLSGVWLSEPGGDPYPQAPDVYSWAQEIFDERAANSFRDHPHTECLPGDAPTPYGGGSPFISKIVQKPELMIVLLEDLPGYRQIFIDGRPHPEEPNPSWVGHSIGRWEGDVLVVDTVGYNNRGWMNVYPRTEDLHVVERYTRTEYGRMMIEVTIEDPTVFKKPWIRNNPVDLVPQEELFEFVCENNKWSQAAKN